MEEFRIVLAKEEPVYFPGQIVGGFVLVKLKEPIKARSVVISFSGKAKTAWTMWEQYSANRSTKSEAVPYWAECVYADLSSTVWTPPPNTTYLPAGLNQFPFSFLVPSQAPPTFEGSNGFIRYVLKAKIDRPWLFDQKAQLGFTVAPHFDLTTLIYAPVPVQKILCKQLGKLWFKHGSIEAKVWLAKSGYVPGESIILNIDIINKSKRDVNRIEASLIQGANYTAYRHATRLHYGYSQNKEIEHRTETRVVVQYVEEFRVPKHSTGTYNRMLAVPPVVPSFNVCEIVQVNYYLKLKIVAKGKLSNTISGELPLLIGTIPVKPSKSNMDEAPVRDYFIPPQPSVPDNEENIHYADCLFGKGTMPEDSNEKVPDYTPKYIFCNQTF